jgi:hypothetical protein
MATLTEMVQPQIEGMAQVYRRAVESTIRVNQGLDDLSEACFHTSFCTLATMGAVASHNIQDTKTAGLLAGTYIAVAGIEFARAVYHYLRTISD